MRHLFNVLWIAIRHLSARSGYGLSMMTTISIVGVAVGVATLIIVLSVMGGFEENLRKKMLLGEPHVELMSKNANAGFSVKNDLSIERVKQLVPEATAIEMFTKADVVLKHGSNLQSAELIGVDPHRKDHLWIFSTTMVDGNLESLASNLRPRLDMPISEGDSTPEKPHEWPGIILGEGLVDNLSADIGDEILVINPLAASDTDEAMLSETNMRRYVLSGIFRSQDVKYDSKWAVVSLSEGRRFLAEYDSTLDDEQYVSGIALNITDPLKVENAKKKLDTIPDIAAVTWQESNQALLYALKLEKFAMGSILMLIVVVAAFSISGTLMMTVFHRRTQVCLLRALGMSQSGVSQIFLAHGFAIGTIGILGGLIFGLGVSYLVYKLQFVPLPQGVYYQNKLPVKFLPETYGVICAGAWIFALLASTYPAMVAARQSPSSGLRM